MVTVGFDDANLVGVNFLIYAKFVDVSDGRVGRFLREEFGMREKLCLRESDLDLQIRSSIFYTRSSSCEVSVKVA
ncbi:MAG: hypothetical protein ABEL51_04355 [Salinibacter sp.]